MRKSAAALFVLFAGLALVAGLDRAPLSPLVPPWLLPAALTDRSRLPHAEVGTPPPVVPSRPDPERQVTLLLAGDTGLNTSFQPVHAGFALRYGAKTKFDDATPDIGPQITGDFNFANLETVVTDRNDIGAVPKMFGFRTHPDGVRELQRIGFNIFSTANNHALDYGPLGAGETLRHLEALGVAQAGLGRTRAAAAMPAMIERRGVRLALGAIGIGGGGFGAVREDGAQADQLPYTEREMAAVVAGLVAAEADYRVVSAHYGNEFDVTTSAAERQQFLRVLSDGADLVVGHHQHVAAGIELVDGKAIVYGLGNFLHWGTQDMGRHDMCRDYGLVARLHLSAGAGERLAVRAIEAIPVTNMHVRTRRLDAAAATARVHVLNHLNRQFGATGVTFGIEADGTGLYCGAGAERLAGSIGARCSAAPLPQAPSPALAARIETACATRVVRAIPVAQDPDLRPEGSGPVEGAVP